MDTSLSLLETLARGAETDSSLRDEAWSRWVDVYRPLVRGWLIRHGANSADVDDVMQDIFAVVVRKLPEFQRAGTGAFRGWLRAITINCVRDFWRQANRHPTAVGGSDFGQFLDQWSDDSSPLSQIWNREHDAHVIKSLIEIIKLRCSEHTWALFERLALEGRSAEDVAREFGTTPNAVFVAKSRVMSQFRKFGNGLID